MALFTSLNLMTGGVICWHFQCTIRLIQPRGVDKKRQSGVS